MMRIPCEQSYTGGLYFFLSILIHRTSVPLLTIYPPKSAHLSSCLLSEAFIDAMKLLCFNREVNTSL